MNEIVSKLNTVNFPLWIILAVVGVVLLYKVSVAGGGKWHDDFLSLSISKGFLGVCATLIVLHHLAQALGPEMAGTLASLENVGVVFVGFFFFFSGYGLLKSKMTKPDYFKGFFRKRLLTIWIPFFTSILVFLVVQLLQGCQYKPMEIVSILIGWQLINSHMWYIVEIALFYLAFFLFFKFIKEDSIALAAMTVFTVVFIFFSLSLGHGEHWFQGEWWFNSSFLFVIGMFVAYKQDSIIAFAKKYYYGLAALLIAAVIPLYMGTIYMLENYSYYTEFMYEDGRLGFFDKLRCLSLQLPFVIVAVLLVLLITMKIQFKNKALDFLGKISLELYLIHNLFINLYNNDGGLGIQSPFMYVILVLISSIIAAIVLHFTNRKIVALFSAK